MTTVNTCNDEMPKTDNKYNDREEFTVLLNGEKDLEKQLDDFKKACRAHERHSRKLCRKRYYNVGLIAKIEPNSPAEELKLLMKNGGRTFLLDRVTYKPEEVDKMLKVVQNAIEEQQSEENVVQVLVGLALQITGDCCRIGRFRNNCSVFLQRSDTTTLTSDIAYKYSSYKEIMYVINLKYYLNILKLGDEICIGKEVCGKVVKKLKHSMALLVHDAGIINSFEYIKLPSQCQLQSDVLTEMFEDDLEYATKIKTDFIVMPQIRCVAFLKLLYQSVKERKLKLIGNIDLQFASKKMLDLINMIRLLDILWIPDLFTSTVIIQNYICQDVIPIAKCLKRPIMGTVPIECCSDFKSYENHEYLWKIDSIYIEKSQWCNKYPLIVKKLQPFKDFRRLYTERSTAIKSTDYSYNSVVNFIIRTITSVECQCIFLCSKCESSMTALGRSEIYCPVYVLFPLDDASAANEKDNQSRIEMAKMLNFYRNLRPIIYTEDMNKCKYKPIDFGIAYARRNDCIKTGDFIITVEVGVDEEENMQLDVGEDVVIMRAFYLPPLKEVETYQCF